MRVSLRLLSALCLLTFTFCSSTPPALSGPAAGSDEFTIQSTVLAVYNVVSGPAGRRDWDRFKELFAPGGRLVSVSKGEVSVMTPDEYVTKSKPYFDAHALFQRPVETHVDRFKDVAHVTSRYESRNAATDEKPYARGVSHAELVRSGEGWRVLSIVWEEE
jgi:hypothetical protein